MSRLRSVLTSLSHIFSDNSPKAMGRWAIVYCPDKVKAKVDLTNEDHCGPCGQYGIQSQSPRVNAEQTILEPKKQ